VSRYEVGERRLDVIELARVARVLNTTVVEPSNASEWETGRSRPAKHMPVSSERWASSR
jgi:hypothetical protein